MSLALAAVLTSLPIINGNYAILGQFPTVVAVHNTQACTGTLIAPDLVLTAAHCVHAPSLGLASQAEVTSRTTVMFDTIEVAASGGRIIAASETIPIGTFRVPGDPDLGLVFLAEAVTDIEPMPLNLDPAGAPTGVALTMIGFGKTATGSTGRLLYTAPKASESCTAFAVNNALFLCVDQHSGAGICEGDGGGPALATVDGRQRLVGVASYADAECDEFGAHMRTDAIVARQFLHEHAPELVPDPGTTPPTPLVPDDDCNVGGASGLGSGIVMLAALAFVRRPRRRATR
ncbi:MAG TPA: S1 family peptidase [Kofleriaceae bacterium]|nr:S1 family peptidase [Kofleriaceae bacterium]